MADRKLRVGDALNSNQRTPIFADTSVPVKPDQLNVEIAQNPYPVNEEPMPEYELPEEEEQSEFFETVQGEDMTAEEIVSPTKKDLDDLEDPSVSANIPAFLREQRVFEKAKPTIPVSADRPVKKTLEMPVAEDNPQLSIEEIASLAKSMAGSFYATYIHHYHPEQFKKVAPIIRQEAAKELVAFSKALLVQLSKEE